MMVPKRVDILREDGLYGRHICDEPVRIAEWLLPCDLFDFSTEIDLPDVATAGGDMARAGLRAAAFTALISGSAHAQTLNQALRDAYRNNPTLALASAQYAAQQAQIEIARSAGRPSVDLNGSFTRSQTIALVDRWTTSYRSESAFNLPLYSGGRVRAAIRSARARAEAARFDYIVERQTIQIAVVSAYLNVLVSEEAWRLQNQHVAALEEDVRASQAEEREGSATKTDTQQSFARLAVARADRSRASSALQIAREQFREVVGHYPHDLVFPGQLPAVPASNDEALDIARRDNPALRSLSMAIEAAISDERVARGLRRPTVAFSARVAYGRDTDPSIFPRAHMSAVIGITLTVPLYQGGLPGAAIRQARDIVEVRRYQWQSHDDQVRAATITDAASIRAADEDEVSAIAQISANREALKGVRLGEQFGDRTRLDILNAEQELLQSELMLSQVKAQRYMSRVEMLSTMGALGDLDEELAPGMPSDGRPTLPQAPLPERTLRPEHTASPPAKPILKLAFNLADLDTAQARQPLSSKAAGRVTAATRASPQATGRLGYDLSGFA